ncbi:hypothetical protein K7432_007610 [Basidiobolus ranarum]|uniref:Uncharacterized protein n=1 Tax=Basidiobolus ranarum TaxID=34480 RepID=A0ABR2WT91_9FUNG
MQTANFKVENNSLRSKRKSEEVRFLDIHTSKKWNNQEGPLTVTSMHQEFYSNLYHNGRSLPTCDNSTSTEATKKPYSGSYNIFDDSLA